MIFIFILDIAVLLSVWTYYYRRHWSLGVLAELSVEQSYVYAGERNAVLEKIENHKKMPVPVLEVSFHMPKELVFSDMENTNISDYVYKRDVFSILGNQRIIRRLPIDCTKRGYFRVEEVDFTSFSMLYENRYSTKKAAPMELYVYAARTDVSDLLTRFERMLGSVQCAKRMYEDPFAFRGIREYTINDPMKTINWKASAKTGSLMVNSFDSTLTERIMIYLDLQDDGILRHEALVEDSISVAATFASKVIAQGMEVGLAVNVPAEEPDNPDSKHPYICMEPAQGRGHLNEIERTLARRNGAERTMPFADMLSDMPQDTIIVLISKNIASTQKAVTAALQNVSGGILDGIPGFWVVPYGNGTEKLPASSGNLVVYPRKVAGA